MDCKQPWDFGTVTPVDDALGQLWTGPNGETTIHEIFQPGRVVPLLDAGLEEDPDFFDAPRGLSDYIGNAGYHPDRTPIDVLIEGVPCGLSVGYQMMAEGDDSYLGRYEGTTY